MKDGKKKKEKKKTTYHQGQKSKNQALKVAYKFRLPALVAY